MKLLITGATGFIGRQVMAQLEKDDEVEAVPSTVDLFNDEAVRALLEKVQPTHLLHLAWVTDHGEFWESEKNEDWLEASKKLVHEFLKSGGERVVATGSCAEYDWSEGHCVEDITPLEPHTLYGKTKKAFYKWLMSTECSVAWARIFHLYGPHEDSRRLVSAAILSLMNDKPFKTSEGTQIRNFLQVEDVASAIVMIVKSGAEGPINIGAPENMTIREVLEKIGGQLGKTDRIEFGALPMRPDDPAVLTPDTQKLQQLGWKPALSLDKGLKKTIEWWRNEKASH
jgi:nucleoside-diphosphate-sugar epimerase